MKLYIQTYGAPEIISDPVKLKTWINLEIQVKRISNDLAIYTVKKDNVLIQTENFVDRKELKNVKVFAADNYHYLAQGSIKNIEISSWRDEDVQGY